MQKVGGVRCYWALVVPKYTKRNTPVNPSPTSAAFPPIATQAASGSAPSQPHNTAHGNGHPVAGPSGTSTGDGVGEPSAKRRRLSIDTSLANTLAVPPLGSASSNSTISPTSAGPNAKLELQFLHLDPVLSSHLARQKMSMVGRGVIEFIHPAERERECFHGILTVSNSR